jgi:hypothetical protein
LPRNRELLRLILANVSRLDSQHECQKKAPTERGGIHFYLAAVMKLVGCHLPDMWGSIDIFNWLMSLNVNNMRPNHLSEDVHSNFIPMRWLLRDG